MNDSINAEDDRHQSGEQTAGDGVPTRPLCLHELHVQAGDRVLLSDTSVTIPAAKITVIVGGSGAGKSVLLRVLAGLLPHDGDVISWRGQIGAPENIDATKASGRGAMDQTQRVGIVFQQFALFDELSPTANVQFAIDHRTNRRKRPLQSAKAWLDELGVPARTPIAGLSGGQKQRLAIARTLAADPDVILYDEPTSGLDAASGRKVAELIRQTQTNHSRTSIVVTHDYETLLPIADEVLLLDSAARQLVSIPESQWDQIADRMESVALEPKEPSDQTVGSQIRSSVSRTVDQFLTNTGGALVAAAKLPIDALPIVPRIRWGTRFLMHYLRLVGGPSAWFYLVLAGLIVGFTGTYFTFRFLPFRLYTQPLLIDELLSSIGFALYRILVPVLATVLIAARCGAAVAADVGVKRYGGQVDALKTLGVRPQAYLLVPIVLAFLIATPMLEWLAFSAAKAISLVTFTLSHDEIGPHFWQQHFYRNLIQSDSRLFDGWGWVMLKNLVCGVGTAAIGYYRGIAPKQSASDVSHAITSTVLWTTLYVLVVHFVVALLEF
ncbi:ABC transporter permease [Planctomycetes bacterium K23_9]|uniref:Sulfate/thiosulfate import ATP-binding protein CysA n=1 Tax=Stieleria marina TaxID=1930275 RepID=A0A517NVT7_9BACT|nr:Sulfate/thiosulfate import ATP-binding protein CysA [Planctomycetes bacterium K23_9]